MDEKIKSIITHSLGLGNSEKPYRRYYCSDPDEFLLEAVDRGLMTGPVEADWIVAPYWYVTEKGAELVGHKLPD